MKKITLKLCKKGNGYTPKLSEILPEIPTNTILHKRLTGLGATYCEIKANRHSIIVEANVPVIIDKCRKPVHKDDNLIGVYEGVTPNHLIKYIQATPKDRYYKILTTPESFWKIKKAFEKSGINMYHTCFCLLDECHRFIKDVDYREDIALPFDDFFLFKNKALVSATPIEFSDPRFDRFEWLEVVPQFETKQHIKLYPTNNIGQALNSILQENKEQSFHIFLNQRELIYQIMTEFNLQGESAVFCSPKSVERLQDDKFFNAYDEWKPERLKKYNFYTSRFNCSLDIELKEDANVILITDVSTFYTRLDPYTDIWQIIGRFRNGVASVRHITNLSQDLPSVERRDILEEISFLRKEYDRMLVRYESATSLGMRKALQEIVSNHPYRQFLNRILELDYNRIDNYILDQIVTSYYQSIDSLTLVYSQSELYQCSVIQEMKFNKDVKQIKERNKSKLYTDKRKEIVRQLELLGVPDTDLKRHYRDALYEADHFIVTAYEAIGKAKIEELNYSRQAIQEAMLLKEHKDKQTGAAFVQLIYNSFITGHKYTLMEIKEEIRRIHTELGLPLLKGITAQTLNKYFETTETSKIICLDNQVVKKKERALLIVRRKL